MRHGSMNQHISRQFDNELENVRTRVLAMGGLVEEQSSHSIKALIEGDIAMAEAVIKNGMEVNTLEVTVDRECTQILVRRQPAASDLRLVIAVTKTITDLERIGDEAQKIAKMAIKLAENQGPRSYYVGINAMGKLVCKMVHDALDAFARTDSKSALLVARKEPESDEQYGAILRQLIEHMMEDPENVTGAMDAVWTARALERIGDHARNICENVIYLVEGKDVRHTSIAQMAKELDSGI